MARLLSNGASVVDGLELGAIVDGQLAMAPERLQHAVADARLNLSGEIVRPSNVVTKEVSDTTASTPQSGVGIARSLRGILEVTP